MAGLLEAKRELVARLRTIVEAEKLCRARIYIWFKEYIGDRSLFNELTRALSRIAVFDYGGRKWVVSIPKVVGQRDGVKEALEVLSRNRDVLGIMLMYNGAARSIGFLDLYEYLMYIARNPVMIVKPYDKNPNYYLIPWKIADAVKASIEAVGTFTVRKYDQTISQFVDVPIRLYKRCPKGILFPRGLMSSLEDRVAKAEDVVILAEPFAPWVIRLYDHNTGISLRDYQVEAVASILGQMARYGAVVLQAATGSGKTEIAVDIAKRIHAEDPGAKIFFLSLSVDLLYQFKRRCMKYGLQAGIVSADLFDVAKPVIAVTIQSLVRAIEKVTGENYNGEKADVRMDVYDVKEKEHLVELYRKARLVIVDECHHVPASTVKYVLRHAPESLRLGLSATPWRDDGRDKEIYAWAGDVAPRRITSSELITKGYLVPAYILVTWFSHPSYRELETRLMGWGNRKYSKVEEHVYYLMDRNEWIAGTAKMLHESGFTPGLVLVKQREHCRILASMLKARGLRAEYATSEVDPARRDLFFEMLRKGKLDFIVATTLADEGLDLPPLRSLVLAGAGKSRVRTMQRIGRVIRPWKGKKIGLVVDIADNIMYMREHAVERMKMYSTEPKWVVRETRHDRLVSVIEDLQLRLSS